MKKSTPSGSRPPSLRSLADACGISYQTASRILNGREDLHRPEMVKLVREKAIEIGYRRNLLARGMLTGRSMTVGVMLPYYINRGFNTRILEGIQSELARHDYMAMIIAVEGSEEDIKHSHQLIERRVDGVIFRPHPYGESDSYLRELMQHKVPLVSVVDIEQSLNQPLDFVGVDESLLGVTAARYLLDVGHRTIGFTRIGDAPFDKPLNVRFAAFAAEIEAGGGKVVTTPRSHSPEFDAAAVRRLLKMKKRPTAIFCSVDDIAFGTLSVARELGLSIPDDLSLIGSSNYAAAKFVSPPLTSFDQRPMDIGKRAAELLIRQIQFDSGTKPVSRIHVGPEMIRRDSVAPPAGN